ncbi:50S ribosomal protein L23 [uncultured archaeon]|nr:50S ribosomal protein L23 [uncultured archaeon]
MVVSRKKAKTEVKHKENAVQRHKTAKHNPQHRAIHTHKKATVQKVSKKTKEQAPETKAPVKVKSPEAAVQATSAKAVDAWNVLKFPYLTEKSTRMIESQNKLVFIVADRSTKAQIKEAVEAVFGIKVKDVNTTSTMRGEKKAYVRLAPEFKAVDVATKLGMM